MKNKSAYSLVVTLAAGTLFVTNVTVRADDTDNRIEASALKSYVFKTYLAADSVTLVTNSVPAASVTTNE